MIVFREKVRKSSQKIVNLTDSDMNGYRAFHYDLKAVIELLRTDTQHPYGK